MSSAFTLILNGDLNWIRKYKTMMYGFILNDQSFPSCSTFSPTSGLRSTSFIRTWHYCFLWVVGVTFKNFQQLCKQYICTLLYQLIHWVHSGAILVSSVSLVRMTMSTVEMKSWTFARDSGGQRGSPLWEEMTGSSLCKGLWVRVCDVRKGSRRDFFFFFF